MKRIAPLVLVIVFVGCGDWADHTKSQEPLSAIIIRKPRAPLRYDATSELTQSKSSEAMKAAMTPEEQERFEADLMRHIVAYSGHLDRATPEASTNDGELLMKPLHGLTAAEIHAKAAAEEKEYGPGNAEWEREIREGRISRRTTVP